MNQAREAPCDLAPRFVAHARSLFGVREDAALPAAVVACSGGLDSMVLAHLLRFAPDLPPVRLTLAHFDHRMRPGSERDARWLGGVARAWELPLRVGSARHPLESEAEARDARYAFLRSVQAEEGARWLLTGHHADDQAETVLFRALRGTGLSGLRGIPEKGPGGLARPLLPFRREELGAHARLHRIPWREDPTNAGSRWARNVLRNEILPRAEAAVAPGARRSLVRLARLARAEEGAWRSLLPELLEGVVLAEGEDRIVLGREALLGRHPAVRARLLRALAERLGAPLEEAGTRAALQFTRSGASGRRRSLSGGLALAREFDRLVLSRRPPAEGGEPLEVAEPGEGRGTFVLDGRTWRARWRCGDGGGCRAEGGFWSEVGSRSEVGDSGGGGSASAGPSGGGAARWSEAFAPDALVFPLRFRGWLPGDRIRMPYGSKKLKKLFAERRIPAGARAGTPVLVGGDGRVLWVPGHARADDAPAPAGGASLIISLEESDTA